MYYQMDRDIEAVLADEKKLTEICDRLAARITEDFKDSRRKLIFVVVLKGSVFFAADLLRRIPLECSLEVMKVSSYGSATESSGFIQIHLDIISDVTDANVVLVEDIIDSGRTLARLTKLLTERGAHSVRCCSLLDKPDRRQVPINADYVGMRIPDVFVVGYGLDYDENYRNLPFVGILKPTVYEK